MKRWDFFPVRKQDVWTLAWNSDNDFLLKKLNVLYKCEFAFGYLEVIWRIWNPGDGKTVSGDTGSSAITVDITIKENLSRLYRCNFSRFMVIDIQMDEDSVLFVLRQHFPDGEKSEAGLFLDLHKAKKSQKIIYKITVNKILQKPDGN